MKYDFLHKKALYRESGKLFLVEVIEHIENEQEIQLNLKVLENKVGYETDDLMVEYQEWEQKWDEFSISGAWGLDSYSNDIFSIAYVGLKMNFRQTVIDAFLRNEEDWLEIWHAK